MNTKQNCASARNTTDKTPIVHKTNEKVSAPVNAQFKINDVAFDMEAKEHVLITNGRCVLDHSNPDAFAKSHGANGVGACQYEPHEAIAIRAFPTDNGKAQIAWTYRSINAASLRPCDESAKAMFQNLFNKKRSKFNIGRI